MNPNSPFWRQLEAFNSRDVEGFIGAYAEDAEIQRDGGVPLRGRDEIRAFYEQRFEDIDLNCDVRAATFLGDRWVVAHELVRSSRGIHEVVAVFDCSFEAVLRSAILSRSVVD
jgi:hypothetical protein